MTDDYRADGLDFIGASSPRPYHFYKVKFVIHNTYTDEYKKAVFYVSAKRNLNWLQGIIPGRYTYPLATDYFRYTYLVEEIEDNDDIIFHHVTTKQDWERTTLQYFLNACASIRWKISWKLKIKRFFNKFKDRKPRRIEIGYSV